jgi:hypothetical protein
MKKIILSAAILFSCLLAGTAKAQVGLSVGVNIGSQPDWGPVGYDHADYYYMPDIETYYDVPSHEYVYYNNNVWVHSRSLPVRYRNYDLYHGYKVVVNDRNPWMHHDIYRSRYASYRGRRGQGFIRDSHDARYRNHWRDERQHRAYDHRAHVERRAYDHRAHVERRAFDHRAHVERRAQDHRAHVEHRDHR